MYTYFNLFTTPQAVSIEYLNINFTTVYCCKYIDYLTKKLIRFYKQLSEVLICFLKDSTY